MKGGRRLATEKGGRKVRTGRVVSDKMQKTVVVVVEDISAHPLYGRRLRRTKRLKVHDEASAAHVGDTVRVEETRPLSHDKHWRLLEVLERARG